MKWVKKGHVFKPSGEFDWMKEYAQVPTPIVQENRLKIYFTTRRLPVNNLYKSEIGYIEVDRDQPNQILTISQHPVLGQGVLGSFDEFGVMPGSLIEIDNKLIMYYTGWSREQSVPYSTSIGAAISFDQGKTFSRLSTGPILSKSINDPFLVNGPFVLYDNGTYHMWYSSAYTWLNNENKIDPIYKIKHASSNDGITWKTSKNFIIEEKIPNEAQNAPCVYFYDQKFYLIFCYRMSINFRNNENGYKLGLAVSEDLINWKRLDDPTLKGNESEWDKHMKAYPRVINVDGKYLLFYNGNYFGKDGFGWAELDHTVS